MEPSTNITIFCCLVLIIILVNNNSNNESQIKGSCSVNPEGGNRHRENPEGD